MLSYLMRPNAIATDLFKVQKSQRVQNFAPLLKIPSVKENKHEAVQTTKKMFEIFRFYEMKRKYSIYQV